jgi:hypothetical protein
MRVERESVYLVYLLRHDTVLRGFNIYSVWSWSAEMTVMEYQFGQHLHAEN